MDWADTRSRFACFEDEAVLVLNKPYGISVMGERHGTDLVSMAQESGETIYPVHRIDKATSGVILFAKEMRYHSDLTRQFSKREVMKSYLAVVKGTPPRRGVIELPLSVGRKNRVRVAAQRSDISADPTHGRWSVPAAKVFTHVRHYPSETRFGVAWTDGAHTLLVAQPTTGRRHQIRVHLAWIGHPIVGDPLFDKNMTQGLRTCLHSWKLTFSAKWLQNSRIDITAPPGPDLWDAAHLSGMTASGEVNASYMTDAAEAIHKDCSRTASSQGKGKRTHASGRAR